MSAITDIADAVALEIDTAPLSQEATPTRRHMPTFDLKDLKKLTVTVMPGSVEITVNDRTRNQYVYGISVGVQKIVKGESDTEAIDDLIAYVDEIADLFKRATVSVSDLGTVPCRSQKIDPVFSREEMENHSMFTSVVLLEFVSVR